MKLADILSLRQKTFHLDKSLTSLEEAIEYVNQRGFIFFWPIKDCLFPSLWVAVAGDRPVPNEHDDPAHITWRWKDSMLGKDAWYYAKVLRKKATLISMNLAPSFYALSENFGDPFEDYLILYRQGKLTQEAKLIYEAILKHGPLDTIRLRKEARLSSPSSDSRFNKALTDLQADFKLVPIGVSEAGAWHYSFIYDLTSRHYPQLLDQARFISDNEARQNLTESFFRSLIAAPPQQLQKCFQWSLSDVEATLSRLVSKNILHTIRLDDAPGIWYILRQI